MTETEAGPGRSRLPEEGPEDRASCWELVAIPIRRYRMILLFSVLYCGLQVSQEFMTEPRYESGATFRPRNAGRVSNDLGRLAVLAGLPSQLTSRLGNFSAEFFIEIMRSRYVLDEVVAKTYKLSDGRTMTLPDLLEVRPRSDNEALRRRHTRREIRDALNIEHRREAGLVRFRVVTKSAEVSYEVARALLSELNSFHSNIARNDAIREKEFIADQLKYTAKDVRVWEDSLQTFLTSNREVGWYSELTFERDRIQAELTQRRQVHTQLQMSYLQAGINEAREAPALLVLAPPRLPRLSTRDDFDLRNLVRWLVVGVLGGTMVAIGVEWLLRLWDYQNPVIVVARENWPRLTSLAFLRARFWPR